MNAKRIEKALINSIKSLISKPSKQQLDLCKQRARAIYKASYDREENEVLGMIRTEALDIALACSPKEDLYYLTKE